MRWHVLRADLFYLAKRFVICLLLAEVCLRLFVSRGGSQWISYSLVRPLPLVLACATVVCVFVYEVRPLLIERRAIRRRESLCCMTCGYYLFAASSDRCPECGAPISEDLRQEIRRCAPPQVDAG